MDINKFAHFILNYRSRSKLNLLIFNVLTYVAPGAHTKLSSIEPYISAETTHDYFTIFFNVVVNLQHPQILLKIITSFRTTF